MLNIDNTNANSDSVSTKNDESPAHSSTHQLQNESLTTLTIGQKLRRAREAKSLTQEAVAKQLFIHKQIISALEEDNFGKLTAPVYARGYLLAYARLLQLPEQPLLDEFTKITAHSRNQQPPIKILHEIPSHNSNYRQHHWLGYIAAIIILISLGLWVYNRYEQITTNKALEKSTINTNATSNTTTNTSDIGIPTTGAETNTNTENKPTAATTNTKTDTSDTSELNIPKPDNIETETQKNLDEDEQEQIKQ